MLASSYGPRDDWKGKLEKGSVDGVVDSVSVGWALLIFVGWVIEICRLIGKGFR